MARRIVFLGAKREAKQETTCPALEIDAVDACALVDTGMARVCVAKQAGILSDALVITFTDRYVKVVRIEMDPCHREDLGSVYEKAFESVKKVLGRRAIAEFEVPTPIPFE